jgi:hypothetical protein
MLINIIREYFLNINELRSYLLMQDVKMQHIICNMQIICYFCVRKDNKIVNFIYKSRIKPNLFGLMNDTIKVTAKVTAKVAKPLASSKKNLVRLSFSFLHFVYLQNTTKVVCKCKMCRNFLLYIKSRNYEKDYSEAKAIKARVTPRFCCR